MESSHPSSILRRVSVGYSVALIAIAAFAGLAWVTQQWLLSAQKDNATLINVSGRQRMLSQQVALAAVQAAVQDDPAARDAAQEKMRRGVEQLKTSHQAILYGSDELGLTAQISDAARQYYVETLNPQFDEYIELSDSLVAEPAVSGDARLQLLQKRSETVLVRLNHAVMLHQAAAEADVAHLQTAELLILLATLMTLLLEALLVYLPLLRQLGQTFAALDQNKALQRALEAARQARRQLDEALDAIPVGFAAWTQTGELQICNERYQEMHPQLAPLLEPGVRYVDILNHADQLGVPSPDTDQGGTLEERLQAHALPRAAEEQQDGRGEWALVSRHQTSSGRMVSTWTDISQRKRYEAQLEQLALYDSLTGLANRERFEAVLAQTLRDGQPGAVMMFDLDRFKLINDTWGHPIGDALLRKVGERLRDLLPETDLLARFGGDEFILLHGSGDVASSRQTAEAIIDTLSQRFLVEERSLSVGVSAGIVLTTSEPERTPEELLRCADLALYEAKARGGDQFVFYSAELDASAAEVLRLSMELRGAIDDGQLELFYQPIVCGKQLSHLEALLRWRHPELGLLTPNRFLTNKLGSGQMRAISREVITQACAAMARWDDLGWAPISVAVNLSAVEFSDPQLTNLIVDQLQRNGLPGNRLKLELTESTVMDISPDLLARMEGLQKLDVEIALDDFGTGYSSLAWLQRLPIRTLKIDRAFICGLPEDQSSAAIVNAILSMSRRMGLKVIAEGVETPEQRERLVGAGCDTLQGWLFSRPMFEDQLLQWLEENPQLFTQTARSA